jgi:hypothetical protein
MEAHRHATAIGVQVMAMTTALSSEPEAVALKRSDKSAGCERPETGILDHPTVTAIIG